MVCACGKPNDVEVSLHNRYQPRVRGALPVQDFLHKLVMVLVIVFMHACMASGIGTEHGDGTRVVPKEWTHYAVLVLPIMMITSVFNNVNVN